MDFFCREINRLYFRQNLDNRRPLETHSRRSHPSPVARKGIKPGLEFKTSYKVCCLNKHRCQPFLCVTLCDKSDTLMHFGLRYGICLGAVLLGPGREASRGHQPS